MPHFLLQPFKFFLISSWSCILLLPLLPVSLYLSVFYVFPNWPSHVILIGDLSTMAASRYKDKDGGVLFSFSGVWVSWLHTILACCMFSFLPSALEALMGHATTLLTD